MAPTEKPTKDLTKVYPVKYRLVKVSNIGYVSILYIVLGLGVGFVLNTFIPPFLEEEAKKKSVFRLTGEVFLHFWLLSILTYGRGPFT